MRIGNHCRYGSRYIFLIIREFPIFELVSVTCHQYQVRQETTYPPVAGTVQIHRTHVKLLQTAVSRLQLHLLKLVILSQGQQSLTAERDFQALLVHEGMGYLPYPFGRSNTLQHMT